MFTDAYIKCKVEELYALEDVGTFPVNVLEIAKKNGVTVRFEDLGSLKGLYVCFFRQPYILLQKDLPLSEQREVCAHELGHHILHQSLTGNAVWNDYELYRRDLKTEREADLFACHLLLPDKAVTDALGEERLLSPDSGLSPEKLAATLSVSPSLLRLKLQSMGLIP